MHEVAPVGRDADLAAIAGLIKAAAEGRGGVLVLAAGPGEGRTTMLRAAAAAAAATGVISVPGHADESDVAYGGLERLLAPLDDLVRELPAQWREPLLAVAGGREPEAGPLPLGLAVVALLRRVARERPLMCLFDDADLLDRETWQVIRLVARRLGGAPVVLLASVTANAVGHAAAAGLPMRQLRPLDDEACRELLRRRAPGITDDVAAGLLDIACANAAALVDLATALSPEQRRGYAALPTTLPPDSGLRLRVSAGLSVLPRPARTLLLLAATDPSARPAELLAAAARMEGGARLVADSAGEGGAELAVPARPDGAGAAARIAGGERGGAQAEIAGAAGLSDLDLAERGGLVAVAENGVRFTPGVARSVVYEAEPLGRRHAAHLALAAVLGGRGRRLSALLHLAVVAERPDEELARELMVAAEEAPPMAAARAQQRAAELSGSGGAAAAALLAAARSLMAAGRTHEAGLLVRRAGKLRGSAVVRARARGVLAEINLRQAPAAAQDVLLEVAGELMDADPGGALEALLLAGEACGRTGEPGRYPVLARQVAARLDGVRSTAAPVARSTGEAMGLHQVVGVADLMTGAEEAAFGHLREVLRLAERTAEPAALIRAANTGILLGQDKRAARLAGRAAGLARESGAHALVPAALEVAAYADLAAGRYDLATASALDGAAVARGAGRPDLADTHLALLGLLAAFVGDRESAVERLAAARRADAEVRALGDWAEALLDLVAGQPASAAQRLAGIFSGGSMILRVAVTPHLLEASERAEGRQHAAAVFDQWAGRTRQSGWLALRSRCRALTTADYDAAEDHFREALGWHGRDDDPGFARAHTELLYGRHLRRRRRPAEARDHLRRAVDTFHRLDARPWAEQAVRELRAAGAKVDPIGRTPLTAQQERIAGLVAEGATNREVARQLHLSPRTIDHHLRNVFARLGVRSRTELAHLLAAG
ncbi:helix-turn-helix transcriptional regulator [Paractinoplanes atraurantiacus]|uniref:helix-turn-helix transcriptional regulator n=1 Tax=Paractinoplanes atraurantiacus TaxID=1036182 RepID=UPI0015CF1CED|nr:LuxR family transcriptional regulator [Actinoplanes atraurantiacus]